MREINLDNPANHVNPVKLTFRANTGSTGLDMIYIMVFDGGRKSLRSIALRKRCGEDKYDSFTIVPKRDPAP